MRKLPADISALLLRVALGAIFIPHGYLKIFGNGGVHRFASSLSDYGIPPFLGYAAAWSEFLGAILLIAGLLTRVDAFLLACTMGVATFLVQLPDALYEVPAGTSKYFSAMKGIELPLSLMAGALALVFLGGGRLSLDAALGIERRLAALRMLSRFTRSRGAA